MRAETEYGSLMVMKRSLVLSRLAVLVTTDLWLHLASPNRKVTLDPWPLSVGGVTIAIACY